ncbi:MAG: NAD(P)-dependent oxidoreductase [Rhodocyclales bacterium]|nr:NAD(P)-dependent oxidoreductase [Rhodocyclales bacterium]
MLEAIIAANDACGANVRATVLSRDPARFRAEVPHLGLRPEFEWIVGEPAGFEFPAERFDYLIDFATPSAMEVGAGGTAIVERCLRGSANLIRFAKAAGVRRVLYASSGAVYGRQPENVERLAEDFPADAATVSPYGRLKQRSEALLLGSGLDVVIARGFAFIGPYLPLTDKFAAGSFLRDALAGGPIRIHGDGNQLRSYLYAADLAVWLVALLASGHAGRAYNLGSDNAVSLHDLATRIAAALPRPCAVVAGSADIAGAKRYVPDIGLARSELGLKVAIGLDEAVGRCVAAPRQDIAQKLSECTR